MRPFKINSAFWVTSLVPFPVSKWKTHNIFNGKMVLFSLQWREHIVVNLSLTNNFQSSTKKFSEIWKLMYFFHKNVCVFFHCVFIPHLLLPFGKNLDSKQTIYFEWPNVNASVVIIIIMYCQHIERGPLWILQTCGSGVDIDSTTLYISKSPRPNPPSGFQPPKWLVQLIVM